MSTASTIAECFWQLADEQGDVPALCCFDTDRQHSAPWMTWSELGKCVAAEMERFRTRGVEPGQHVASCLPNGLRWISMDLACQTMGVVHVALDRRLPDAMIARLFEHSGAVHLFRDVGEEMEPEADTTVDFASNRAASAKFSEDWPAQLLYTSGSVGRPKGVLLSHCNLISNARSKLDASPQFATDLRLNILPFTHAYARTCELSTWILSRSRLAIVSDWKSLLEVAPELQPTLLNLVPYLATRLADVLEANSGALGSSLRLLQIGGAAVQEELFRRLELYGLAPVQGYGLTEASPVVSSNQAGSQRPGTVGRAVTGTELRIDEEGVLWVRGPQVMLGYWNDTAATSEVIHDGWLRTGDLAVQDGDGMVRILGRQSEQICLTTGYKVSPEEIEALMLSDGWLEQAVVLGDQLPHISAWVWPNCAEIPGQFFNGSARNRSTLNTTAWVDALSQRIQTQMQHLPRFMIPEQICVLPERLSAEDGTLTPKLTPRRREIAKRMAEAVRLTRR